MARIGATISGLELTLLNRLSQANSAATLNQLRLATEKNFNYPRDNPSIFTALSMFQSRLSTVTTTMSNVTAASSRVTQTQSALSQIRTQLASIRTTLLTDEAQALSSGARATAQTSIDAAVNAISALALTEIDGRRMLDGSATYDVSGRNGTQVTELVVRSTGGVGQVSPGEKAQLTYTGSSRFAAADATVKFTGDKGSTTIAFYATDTLEDMAATINVTTNTTGVTARVNDNTLFVESETTGAGETVTVAVQSGTFAVSGGNGAGTDTGVDTVYGSTPAVSGSVDRAATQAQLVYTGSSAQVAAGDGGTLTITGALGNVSITIADAEALTAVATKINNQSHKTGITAYAAGGSDTLTFTSVAYGSAATLAVSSDAAFSTTGGNNDDTAAGTDMIATIGGITYSPDQAAEVRHRETGATLANSATVKLTGHLGSFTFALTNGTNLTTVASTIAAQKGVTGVNATVDGNDLVLTSTITGGDGQVTVNVSAGTFDTVTGYTPPQAAQLIYTGTNGQLIANADFDLTGTGTHSFAGVFLANDSLHDVRDLINNEVGATGVLARVDGDQLILETVALGSGATMSVTNVVGSFTVTGTGVGVDALASDSGQDAVTPMANLDGRRLTVNQNGFHYEIEFADSFAGRFNTMSVSGDALTFALSTDVAVRSSLAIPSLLAENLGGLSGKLSDLLTGGAAAGLNTNTAQAIRIVDEALGDLDKIEGSVDGFYDAAITSSSNLLADLETDLQTAIDDTDGYDENEQALLLAKNLQIMDNIVAGLAILSQQRSGIITLIQQAAGLI